MSYDANRLPILLDCIYGEFAVHCRCRDSDEVERRCREQGLEIKAMLFFPEWVVAVAAKPGIELESREVIQ